MPQEVDPTGSVVTEAEEDEQKQVPENTSEKEPVFQVLVTTDDQGIPTGVTPMGIQRTALPAVLRMAAKMVDQYLEL